jgi:hypothetical protein
MQAAWFLFHWTWRILWAALASSQLHPGTLVLL